MHNRTVFNFGEFKSCKCSISFSRDYARKGQKNKKALKFKAFLGYIFFIALFWLRGWILCPCEKYCRVLRCKVLHLVRSCFSPAAARFFRRVAALAFAAHSLRVMRCSCKPELKIERVDKACTVGHLTTIMSTNLKSKFASSSIARKQK